MIRPVCFRIALALLPLALAVTPLRSQSSCTRWSSDFGASGVDTALNEVILDQVEFDDGSGPALYACGTFDIAGDVVSACLAKWDGQRWTAFGGSLGAPTATGEIRALAVFDDGSGPALYVGGYFASINGVHAVGLARWTGTTWQEVGGGYGRAVSDLLVFDDGTGAQLYVAGNGLTTLGGAAYDDTVARWNGASWSTPGGAFPWPSPNKLCAHDDGSGPALYIGGHITDIGALTVHNLARWNGASWSEVGGGVDGEVVALASYDDGTGAALFVGGAFTEAGGAPGFNRIARWKSGAWSPLGPGMSAVVHTIAPYDDGVVRALYAAGNFVTAGGVEANGIARWDGASWSALGTPPGMGATLDAYIVSVRSLFVHDDGSGAGSSLFVGGRFASAGAIGVDNIARWNALGWSNVGAENGADGVVYALGSFDSGAGEELYAAGKFRHLGAAVTPGIGKGDGSSWSPALAGAFGSGAIHVFHQHDDGSGPALYVGGSFPTLGGVGARSIARFDGTHWSTLGGGIFGSVNAMASFDDGSGPALWVGGLFSMPGSSAYNIARWDGSAWSTPPVGFNNTVFALATFDDGTGPALYAGGYFTKVGTTFVFGIARWDGTTWSPVGNGFDAGVSSLIAFDDGSGPKLYAGGWFAQAPPNLARSVARWDGTSWEPVGAGFDGSVADFAIFDDGWGEALYAGGSFRFSGQTLTRRVAKWDGSSWSEVGGGVSSWVSQIHAFDDGSPTGAKLVVAGDFQMAGGVASDHIAVLERACPCPPRAYCTAGRSSIGCTPSMGASGTPSASAATPFVVTAAGVDGQRIGLLFYGLSGAQSTPWGATTSFLCVKPPQQRTGQSGTGGTSGACDGALVLDWNAYVASNPSALGAPFQAGTLVRMQGWYRDPPNPKTTSLTDALEFVLCP